MHTQSHGQHARPKAHVVVDPVGWTTVVMLSWHVSAYPDSNVRRHIEVSRIRIWRMLIDRRSPVNRDATQNEAKKDWHIQPVTPAHQEMVFPDDEHARLFRQRARRVWFVMKCWQRAHSLITQLHCLVGRRRRNELKDLVRYESSVRELLSCRVDNIARAKSDRLRCDFCDRDIGGYGDG